MDTVEWGSAEPRRRVLPGLAGRSARSAGYVLAGVAFLAFLGGELLPWAKVQVAAGSTGSVDNGNLGLGQSGAVDPISLGLDRLNTIEALTYHLGWLVLLGLVGYAMVSRPAQRRPATGAAIGVAAAVLGVTIEVVRAAKYSFGTTGIDQSLPDNVSVGIGSGAVLAFVALGLVAAAVLMNLQAGRPAADRVSAGRPAPPAPAAGEGAPVDLTVTPAPPLDERYFARPD